MLIQFYHLTSTNLEHTLPNLTQKIFDAGHSVCIKLADKEAVTQADNWLWAHDASSFLPHGVEGSEHANEQPVYITSSPDDIANKANILIVVDGSVPSNLDGVEKLLDIFNGNDEADLQAARKRWKDYKDADIELTYWQQQQGGGWKKAA